MFATLLRKIRGPDPDQRIDEAVQQLASVASSCAMSFMKDKASNLQAMVDFEHQGDEWKKTARHHLDTSFIFTRYRGELPRRLVKQLDDIIGGMKRVAEHVDIWRPVLGEELPEDAQWLINIIPEMTNILSRLTIGLGSGGKHDADAMSRLIAELDEHETRADKIRLVAERRLVAEFDQKAEKSVKLIAAIKLLDLLEDVIDSANHAGSSLQGIIGRH